MFCIYFNVDYLNIGIKLFLVAQETYRFKMRCSGEHVEEGAFFGLVEAVCAEQFQIAGEGGGIAGDVDQIFRRTVAQGGNGFRQTAHAGRINDGDRLIQIDVGQRAIRRRQKFLCGTFPQFCNQSSLLQGEIRSVDGGKPFAGSASHHAFTVCRSRSATGGFTCQKPPTGTR